jgi:formylmethanofuran dehydrogenase subunit E
MKATAHPCGGHNLKRWAAAPMNREWRNRDRSRHLHTGLVRSEDFSRPASNLAMMGTGTPMPPSVQNTDLRPLLERSAALHRHLCPRQVLGVRAAIYAGRLLTTEFPQTDKNILAILETDGCFADGVSVASGCSMGHRTMRLADYGKVAVTFIEKQSGQALRFSPLTDLRARVLNSVVSTRSRWHAYLEAYQQMAEEEIFAVREVALNVDLGRLIGTPGKRTACHVCGEEILNQREVLRAGVTMCPSCAGESYWRPAG